MLKLNTNLRYGLRLLLSLAQSQGAPLRLKDIAQKENISLRYLRKLTIPLDKAGLVKSVRGPGGGYLLAKKAKDITLLEIINILSRIELIDCLKDKNSCSNLKDCLVRDLWKDFYDNVYETFENKTLKTILNKRRGLK